MTLMPLARERHSISFSCSFDIDISDNTHTTKKPDTQSVVVVFGLYKKLENYDSVQEDPLFG